MTKIGTRLIARKYQMVQGKDNPQYVMKRLEPGRVIQSNPIITIQIRSLYLMDKWSTPSLSVCMVRIKSERSACSVKHFRKFYYQVFSNLVEKPETKNLVQVFLMELKKSDFYVACAVVSARTLTFRRAI